MKNDVLGLIPCSPSAYLNTCAVEIPPLFLCSLLSSAFRSPPRLFLFCISFPPFIPECFIHAILGAAHPSLLDEMSPVLLSPLFGCHPLDSPNASFVYLLGWLGSAVSPPGFVSSHRASRVKLRGERGLRIFLSSP